MTPVRNGGLVDGAIRPVAPLEVTAAHFGYAKREPTWRPRHHR